MDFVNYLLNYLFSSENGFIFSKPALDIALFAPLIFAVCHYVALLHTSRKHVKLLDGMAGFHVKSSKYNQVHWLKGHISEYTNTHEGILRHAEGTVDFPGIFNIHVGPFHSFLHLYHPETLAPVIANSVPKDKLVYGFLKTWIGNGLLRSDGNYWQRHRRLLTPAFHFTILKSYLKVFNDCAKEMLDKLDSTKGKPVEVFEPVGLLTLDTMLRCAMSTTTNCQATKHRHPYVEAIHVLSDVVTVRSRSPLLFFDWIFNLFPIGRRYNKALTVAHTFTEKIIADRRKELQNNGLEEGTEEEELNYQGGRLRNFLDTLLTAQDENGLTLTDEEVREEVDTFLFEGHDTTSSGLAWALYNFAKYPDHQSQCRKEIMDVVGDKENVEWPDLAKLESLTAFLKESLRLYPPVPFTVRQLSRPLAIKSRYNVSGTDAPTGTYICLNVLALQRNRHLWNKPDDFNPDRFSKENLKNAIPNIFMPFSAGSRNCIGQNFAMNEMKVVLAQTLRRFKLSIDPSTPEPRILHEVILRSESGIFIKFDAL